MDKVLKQLMIVTGALASVLEHNLVPEPQATAAKAKVQKALEVINEKLAKAGMEA